MTEKIVLEPMKTVAYCRVSTLKQKHEETIDQQIEQITEYIKTHPGTDKTPGIEIVKWFKDDGLTGFDSERKQYQEMISYMKIHPELKCIIVRDLSRLGRDSFELQRFDKEVIRELDKKLIMCNLNIDTSTKEGKLIYTQMAGIAEYQASEIKERLKYGRDKAYKEDPDSFGRPSIDLNQEVLDKMKHWYTVDKFGVTTIAKLVKSDFNIVVTAGTIRNRLVDMKIKFRDPKWLKKKDQKID